MTTFAFQLGLLPPDQSVQDLLKLLRPWRAIPEEIARKIAEETGADFKALRRQAVALLFESVRHAKPTNRRTFPKVARAVIEDGLRRFLAAPPVRAEDPLAGPKPKKRRSEILDRETELALAQAWIERRDAKARERLLLAYRPLGLTMAQEVARTTGGNIEDLAQEAFVALAESLDKFDPSRGFGFGTFARWHVMGQLRRHIMDLQGPVRIGTNLPDKRVFLQFRRLRAAWEARHQRPLDDEGRAQLAREMNVSLETLLRMEPRMQGADVSLDEPLSPDGEDGATRGSLLVDGGPSPETLAINQVDGARLRKILAEMIAQLPDRDRDILTARLLSEQKTEFQDLGQRLGVTKERVRQIEQKALRTLRANLEARGLGKQALLAAD
jgi:RNA polymerase sigma-32 factor